MLEIERFEYVRVGELLAVVQLRAGLQREQPVLREAALSVSFGRYCASSPARTPELAHRSPWWRRDGSLAWSASFAVALEVVEYPSALFALTAPGFAPFSLPSPELRSAAPGDRRRGLLQGRRRAATVAVAVAVTTAGAPSLSFADVQPRHLHPLVAAVHSPALASVVPKPALHSQIGKPAAINTSLHPVHAQIPGAAAPIPVFSAAPVHVPRSHRLTLPRVHSITPHRSIPVVPHTRVPGHPAARRQQPHPPVAPARHTHPSVPHSHHPSGGAPVVTPHPAAPVHVAPVHDSDPEPATPSTTVAPAGPTTAPTSVPTTAPAPSTGTSRATAAAYSRLSALVADGNQPPAFLIPIYKAAGHRYHVPWRVLAAINSIESDYGRNMSTSSAGAIGWMQFMPSTWAEYGVDVDHRGQPNPYDPHDAIYAAARYLAANDARHDLRKAIFAYNHATWYVDEVLSRAAGIVDTKLRPGAHARLRLHAMRTMARLLNGDPYVWGGGHGGWQLVAGYDCSGFVSTVLHAGGYLAAPQTTQTLPAQPGILPGPGRVVTIFDRTDAGIGDDHVIIDLGGEWWESGGSMADGGGAGVHRIAGISPAYLATFNQILHPRGL